MSSCAAGPTPTIHLLLHAQYCFMLPECFGTLTPHPGPILLLLVKERCSNQRQVGLAVSHNMLSIMLTVS